MLFIWLMMINLLSLHQADPSCPAPLTSQATCISLMRTPSQGNARSSTQQETSFNHGIKNSGSCRAPISPAQHLSLQTLLQHGISQPATNHQSYHVLTPRTHMSSPVLSDRGTGQSKLHADVGFRKFSHQKKVAGRVATRSTAWQVQTNLIKS